MLAATSIGAIWSSCSPDFGKKGVLDRFKQIDAKLMFATDSYIFKGKRIDLLGKLNEIVSELDTLERFPPQNLPHFVFV
jgi:acetoacetyl-CoA synthetase